MSNQLFERTVKVITEHYPEVKIKDSDKTFLGKLLRLKKRGVSMCLGDTIYMSSDRADTLIHEFTHHVQQKFNFLPTWLHQYFSPRIQYIYGALLSLITSIILISQSNVWGYFGLPFVTAFITLVIEPRLLPFEDRRLQIYEAHAHAMSLRFLKLAGYSTEELQKAKQRKLKSMSSSTYMTLVSKRDIELILDSAVKKAFDGKYDIERGLSTGLYDILDDIFDV